MTRAQKRALGRVLYYLLMAVIILYTVFPFYWAIVSSLKPASEMFRVDFFPALNFDNYAETIREFKQREIYDRIFREEEESNA